MKPAIWEILELFNKPISGNNIKFVDSPLQTPKGINDIIKKNWDKQLKEKQKSLTKLGILTEIKPYSPDLSEKPLNGLYEGEKPKMWPGPVVSLKEIRKEDSKINLIVGQTSYPFIAGLKDKEVSKLYKSQGITKPRSALAISTFALTLDNKLVLTVRGPRTNVYPERFYGQGGNPLFTNTDVILHQENEMKDEILVYPEEYNSEEFRFGGIVVDKEEFIGKPDLVGWVPVNLKSSEIKERVNKRDLIKRPNDAVDVIFAPGSKEELVDYLTKKTRPIQFCPPAHAGLVVYGIFKFGHAWAEQVIKKLK